MNGRWIKISRTAFAAMALTFLIAAAAVPSPAASPRQEAKKNFCLDKEADETPVDTRFDEARAKIIKALEETKVASISVAVAKDGKILWEEAFGWADREKLIKATPDTMYSLASISKPITATGLMILVERKRVDLDRPVNTYLGPAKLMVYEGPAGGPALRHVLNHTSGLPLHYHFFFVNEPYRRPGMEETIARYGIIVAPPGEGYFYSNLGYGIVDEIISRVSGMAYRDFMRSEVFIPLGLTHTSVDIGPGLEAFAAQRYDDDQAPIPFYDFDHPGASAVYASAHDLVRFGMFHLKDRLDGQARILKDETIDLMQSEAATTAPEKNYGIGWGLAKDEFGYRTVSHTGGMPGVSTTLKLVPSEGIAVVVLANGRHGRVYNLDREILSALLPKYAEAVRAAAKAKKPEEPKPAAFVPDKALLGEWSGEIKTYAGSMPLTLEVKADGDVLIRVKDELATLLNVHGFKDGVLTGASTNMIRTDEAGRYPHVLYVRVKLRGDELTGLVSATDDKRFALSSWIKLQKRK